MSHWHHSLKQGQRLKLIVKRALMLLVVRLGQMQVLLLRQDQMVLLSPLLVLNQRVQLLLQEVKLLVPINLFFDWINWNKCSSWKGYCNINNWTWNGPTPTPLSALIALDP